MGIDDGILYETLTPLSASKTSNSPPPPPPPPPSSEGYVVFRNEISLDSIIPSSVAPETSSVDYFSLDVSQDNDRAAAAASPPPVEPLTPVQPQRALEGNWFRAHSRFRSPMLQLHQGSSFFFITNLLLLFHYNLPKFTTP